MANTPKKTKASDSSAKLRPTQVAELSAGDKNRRAQEITEDASVKEATMIMNKFPKTWPGVMKHLSDLG